MTEQNSLQDADTEHAPTQLKDEELAPKNGDTAMV